MSDKSNAWILVLLVFFSLVLGGCSVISPPTPISSTASPANTLLVYDAPVSLTIKNGAKLPGTNIAYAGKSATGVARVLIGGQEAAKQTGDTLDWQGTPAPNVTVNLSTRIVSFDDQSLSLLGTSHVEIAKVTIQPGGTPGTAPMEFNAPVTYSLSKNVPIPGTNISYIASSPEGAQFSGIEGYAFRKMLDSLQYVGRLTPQTYLKLDLRVLNFSETSVVLGGTANIKIQPQ